MQPLLLVFYFLAYGSVIVTALDRFNHSRPTRLVSALLFVLLIIVRLIFPSSILLDQLLSLSVYSLFALLQFYVWHRLKKINESKDPHKEDQC